MTIDDAITAIGNNIDYYNSEEKALALYDALNYLIIMRPSGSSINGINMSFAELTELKNTVKNHIVAIQNPMFSQSWINRY